VEKEFHLEVIQVKEEREKKEVAGGFQRTEPEERKESYISGCMGFLYTYTIHSVDNHIYT
jgi:hypothetical protein